MTARSPMSLQRVEPQSVGFDTARLGRIREALERAVSKPTDWGSTR